MRNSRATDVAKLMDVLGFGHRLKLIDRKICLSKLIAKWRRVSLLSKDGWGHEKTHESIGICENEHGVEVLAECAPAIKNRCTAFS
jgi:hypothetical protein